MRSTLLGGGEKRKENSSYKMAKSQAELCLCSSVLWMEQFATDAFGYLAEEISKQSIEGKADCL
jgi:hypothetical protein